jgi:hypothetical protein
MKISKHITLASTIFVSAIASSLVFSNSASAQSTQAKTQVNFDVQPFVRLYYKDAVNVMLKPNASKGADAIGQKSVEIAATYGPDSGVNGGGDAAVNVNTNNYMGKIELKNFWAVQSISQKGTVVKLEVSEPTAKHSDQDSSMNVMSIDGGGEFEPTGLANAQYGNATMGVDMSKARHSGKYTGATITITAENF